MEDGVEDENQCNVSNEISLNISETNDSMMEMKKITTIPVLRNGEKFKSKTSKENSNGSNHQSVGHYQKP